MTITVPASGMHGSWGDDDVVNQIPTMQSALQKTGILTQEIELLDTQRYDIPIYNSWLSHKPQEFPMLSILANLGAGDFINEYFYHWWDEYEGTGLVDTGLDNLRIRDAVGQSSGVPWAIGTAGEIGGKMVWQKCYIASGANSLANAWDTYLAASAAITIVEPDPTTYAATNYSAVMVPRSAAGAYEQVEIQETAPQLYGSTKKLVSLGFSRSGTNKFSYVVGNPVSVCKQYFSALRANDYTYETFASCTFATYLGGAAGSAETVHSLKFTEGASYKCQVMWDNLETAIVTDHDTIAQMPENCVVVDVDRIIFNDSFTKFILVLDFAGSSIDISANASTVYTAASASAGDIESEDDEWYLVTRVTTASLPQIADGTITRILYPGDVFKNKAGWTFTGNGCYVARVDNALLIEEVNTATVATEAATDRVFGANEDSTTKSYGGNSRLSRHLIINMFHDFAGVNSESDPFPTEQQTGYTFTEDGKINNITILNQKPYGITTMRQGQKLRFRDNWTTLRERNFSKFRRIWANKILWEKKSNLSGSTVDGVYKGTMSGLLDYEMFPIKYLQKPLPISGSHVLANSDKGLVFMEWLDSIAKSVNYQASTGKYADKTFLVSHDVIRYLKNTNAILGSTAGGNIFGTNFTSPPPGELTLGLEILKYKTSYGNINFTHDPSLDKDTHWKFPRFLFSQKDGLVRPKWLMFCIDKSFIKLKTQKSRVPKIYGGLQPNNNPFVYEEAMSGAHTLEVRNMMNHAIIDVTPY